MAAHHTGPYVGGTLKPNTTWIRKICSKLNKTPKKLMSSMQISQWQSPLMGVNRKTTMLYKVESWRWWITIRIFPCIFCMMIQNFEHKTYRKRPLNGHRSGETKTRHCSENPKTIQSIVLDLRKANAKSNRIPIKAPSHCIIKS